MPSHRTFFFAVLTILAMPLAAEDFKPGAHKRLPCNGDKEWTWDVYVPKAYAEKPDKRFPVMWHCSAGGNPGFWSLEPWAEKNEVLLIAMNDPKNGLDWPTIHKMQDDVIATSESKLRLHPCLRFSTGGSGGAWMAMFIANRHPKKHAGVIMQIHSGNGTICPKHIAVAFIAGEADTTHPLIDVKNAYEGFKRRGNPVKILTVPGRGHQQAKTHEIVGMLDWMFNYQRIAHPNLTPEERKAVWKDVADRSKACGAIKEPAARRAECESLMSIPSIERSAEYRALLLTWFTASRELAEAKADAAEKQEELFLLVDDPRSRLVPASEIQAIGKALTDLRRDPSIRTEWDALQALVSVQKNEAAVGGEKARLIMIRQAYQAIAQRYPNTRAGKKADHAAKRLSL